MAVNALSEKQKKVASHCEDFAIYGKNVKHVV